MRLEEKHYAEFKRISDEQGITYESDFEMRRQANSLVSLVRILHEGQMERDSWDRRLKDEPKGFSFSSNGRNCSFCKRSVYGEIWYDKNGLKCPDCYEAFSTKLFPQYVYTDKKYKKHITPELLAEVSELTPRIIRNLALRGRITARTAKNGKMIILKRENPDIANVLHEAKEKRKLAEAKKEKSNVKKQKTKG